ncbi:MAG: circadian clock protein KaiB [Leptolyngbyaceae cyanobacterium MO_188.B28]|nr:circadian clock protein KaiB [Leptolyngbyaceae cyanobacterium MO_188.B28]
MRPSPRHYVLKLYVAGETPTSNRALQRLHHILEQKVQGVYSLKVIDVLKNPKLAEEDKILATPTLTKEFPSPVLKFVGDLSNPENFLISLSIW